MDDEILTLLYELSGRITLSGPDGGYLCKSDEELLERLDYQIWLLEHSHETLFNQALAR